MGKNLDELYSEVIAKHGDSYGRSLILHYSKNGHIRNRSAIKKALSAPCESTEHKANRERLELSAKTLISRMAIAASKVKHG